MLLRAKPPATASLPGVASDLAENLAERLNRDLATLTDLAAAYKQAHWNVLGPGFAELDRLFDEFADDSRSYANLVAERAVTLGGVAHGTLEAAVEYSALAPFPVDERAERRLLQELAQRVEHTADEIREAITSSAEDPLTQDLYIEVARGIEKQRWVLLAHLWEVSPTTGE
jgi:starvation-inducible DNA-binding protein